MKYNFKKKLNLKGPSPRSISGLLNINSKNPNVSLILINSLLSKMAKIQGSSGRIDKRKIAILNWIILLENMEVLNFASAKYVKIGWEVAVQDPKV
jgi:hypothetical protein